MPRRASRRRRTPRPSRALRHELLGRSGSVTLLLKQLGSVPAEERPALGQLANDVRRQLEAAVEARQAELAGTDHDARLAAEALDMSAPGRPMPIGHLHPVMTLIGDLREIFHAYGFEVFEGPEIETDEYNFELLNIPPDHPSRDLWDTLYVAEPGSVEAGEPRAGVRRHDPAHPHLAGADPCDARPRAADPRPHARPLLPLRGRRRQPRLRVLPGRGPGRRPRHEPGRPQGPARGGRARALRTGRCDALPARLLPVHRAERRIRHRLPGVRRRGLPRLQAHAAG